ncbi:hypothetical protein V5799_011760, partial [Amblyomma americanum]
MSSATRQQLLDILVRASLQFGMPMFWSFYVGRHPFRPSENAIYMTLEHRFLEWIRDINALSAKGKESDYFRRCAEIVGKTGQSYSRMIEHVLNTHFDIADLVHVFWGEFNMPSFYNLSDPDLRRAVNGYLPDDSQLWPADEIVNLQPELFDKLNDTHLSKDGWREHFKLFLGAYVVWALSPMVSRYLTTSLLEDIGREGSEDNHRFFKCLEALEMVLPLVNWQLHREAMNHRAPTWKVLRLAIETTRIAARTSYGEGTAKRVHGITTRIGANAFNMTSTWEMLDNAYAYLPNDSHASFFKLYRKAARDTVTFFKQSLRRPHHNVFHVPGLTTSQLYRLLVGREVTVHSFLTSSPLYEPWHPVPVLTSLAGTVVSEQLVALLRFGLFHDSRFREYPWAMTDPALLRMTEDVNRLERLVNASGLLPDGSSHEHRELYMASMAAHIASRIQDIPELRGQLGDATAPSRGEQKMFPWVPPAKLFFYLLCFAECGTSGRMLQFR